MSPVRSKAAGGKRWRQRGKEAETDHDLAAPEKALMIEVQCDQIYSSRKDNNKKGEKDRGGKSKRKSQGGERDGANQNPHKRKFSVRTFSSSVKGLTPSG